MGSMKNKWIELQNAKMHEFVVEFDCPKCKKMSYDEADLPPVQEGNNIETEIDVPCIWCSETFKAILKGSHNEYKIRFSEHPDLPIECYPFNPEMYYEQDWQEEDYFYKQIDDPFSEFNFAYEDLFSISKSLGDDNNQNPLNRMIFSQSFAILETYLCDRFLSLVQLTNNHQEIFINQHSEMMEAKFSISEMLQQGSKTANEIINQRIIKIIKTTLFHNLPKALVLFKFYNVDIFPDKDKKDLLMKAVEYRHHCVHRNGKDMEGNELGIFTQRYDLEVLNAMHETAHFIEKNIQSLSTE